MSATNQNAQIVKEHEYFLKMPLHVANLVLEKLEPMDLLTSRKVCRGLRAAVDKLGVFFDAVMIYITEEGHIEMVLDEDEIRYANADGGGTTVTYNDEPCRRIEGENFVEIAFTDLKIVMKHTSIFYISNNRKDNCEIIESFMDFLKSETCIHVKEVGLKFSLNDVIKILPYFDAQMLEQLVLTVHDGSIDQFEKLTQLEHWKNAKTFDLSDVKFDSNKLEILFHFEEILIELDEFSVQSAVQIRDDLMRRSRFQKIHVGSEILNPIEIAKIFKPDYVGGHDYKFEYLNNDEKFSIESRVYSDISYLYIQALKTI